MQSLKDMLSGGVKVRSPGVQIVRMDHPHDTRIGMAWSGADNESCEHHTCIASARATHAPSRVMCGRSAVDYIDGAPLTTLREKTTTLEKNYRSCVHRKDHASA